MVTVLVVDDSRVSRLMTRSIIQRHHPDCEVIEAQSGEEALELGHGRAIDYMLVDVNMPGIDGLTAAGKLKDAHPNAHISLLTANIQESLRDKAVAAGIGFINKPISDDKIAAFLLEGKRECSN